MPGTAGAAHVEGTGLSMHTGRRRCQRAHRVWDHMPIRAMFLACSLPAAGAPDSSLLWGLTWIDQMFLSVCFRPMIRTAVSWARSPTSCSRRACM